MMKSLAMLGAAALLMVVPATPALAEGAIIGDGDTCGGVVPDENGNLVGEQILGTYTSRTTKSGITNFTCHFDLPDELTPPTNRKARGFVCGTPMGPTTNTRINASPGGRMVMSCSIKNR